MNLGLEYNIKIAAPPSKIQYSTVHGSRIRVQQQDGGVCRYNTVWYKLYLGLEYNKMSRYNTVQYKKFLGYHYNLTGWWFMVGVIQYTI